MTRLALGATVAPFIMAMTIVAGCGGTTGLIVRGGSDAKIEEDRAQCLTFVQAHTETTPELAESAKKFCPLSKALASVPEITLTATLRT